MPSVRLPMRSRRRRLEGNIYIFQGLKVPSRPFILSFLPLFEGRSSACTRERVSLCTCFEGQTFKLIRLNVFRTLFLLGRRGYFPFCVLVTHRLECPRTICSRLPRRSHPLLSLRHCTTVLKVTRTSEHVAEATTVQTLVHPRLMRGLIQITKLEKNTSAHTSLFPSFFYFHLATLKGI